MCGGAILIHPCSRVSHIFRDKSPYLKDNVNHIIRSNAARVAEVWLDNYKRFYFRKESYDPVSGSLVLYDAVSHSLVLYEPVSGSLVLYDTVSGSLVLYQPVSSSLVLYDPVGDFSDCLVL